MNDLIERQAAIDYIKTQRGRPFIGITLEEAIIMMIEEVPSAQPEIIRCKDCKFWKAYGYINGKPEFLPKCGFNQIYTSKDDFCSRAERKNNG